MSEKETLETEFVVGSGSTSDMYVKFFVAVEQAQAFAESG
jgi:hypothetical protein